jgi:hypothetical protein
LRKGEQSVEDIILRWPRALKNEREFINQYRKELEKGPESCIDYPGVVPTSCKRLATWRWRELYLDKIASLIEGPDYERAAQTGLEGWAKKQPYPHYVALFTVLDQKAARYSSKGEANCAVLIKEAGPSNVRAYEIECTHLSELEVCVRGSRLM